MRPLLFTLLIGTHFFAIAQSQLATGAAPGVEKKKIRLEGNVLSMTGEVVRKATLHLQSNGPLQSGQPPANYTESTDNAGKFVFEDVAEGRYTLSAEKAGFVTQRYGGRSTGSAGTVIWPKIPDLGSYTAGVLASALDQEGGFSLTGLAPGEYYVAAWNHLAQGLGQSAEFLSRFNGNASLVKLDESGQATVEVGLIPPEKVAAEIARLQ